MDHPLVSEGSCDIMKGHNAPDTMNEIVKGHNVSVNTNENLKGDNEIVPSGSGSYEDKHNTSKTKSEADVSTGSASSTASTKVRNIWIDHAKKDLGYMALKLLSRRDVYDLSHKAPDWDNIDPYSSIDEVFSEDSDPNTNASGEKSEISDTEPVIGTIYYMCECKKKMERCSSRPLRSTRNVVNYANLDDNSDEDSPKRINKKPKVSSGPSSDRIAAQNIIKSTPGTPMPIISPEKDRSGCKFRTKDPSKSKRTNR